MEYDRLIELILEKIHNIRGSRSLSGMLTSDLNMSKASVYRRLHGDVPFTIEELLRLVQKYGISLDELIRSGHAGSRGSRFLAIPNIIFQWRPRCRLISTKPQ